MKTSSTRKFAHSPHWTENKFNKRLASLSNPNHGELEFISILNELKSIYGNIFSYTRQWPIFVDDDVIFIDFMLPKLRLCIEIEPLLNRQKNEIIQQENYFLTVYDPSDPKTRPETLKNDFIRKIISINSDMGKLKIDFPSCSHIKMLSKLYKPIRYFSKEKVKLHLVKNKCRVCKKYFAKLKDFANDYCENCTNTVVQNKDRTPCTKTTMI